MSHLRTRGVRRARRLPTVTQKKPAMCQGISGRICFASHSSSPLVLRCRTASHFVNQCRRGTSELKHSHRYLRSSRQCAHRSQISRFRWMSLESQCHHRRRGLCSCSRIRPAVCETTPFGARRVLARRIQSIWLYIKQIRAIAEIIYGCLVLLWNYIDIHTAGERIVTAPATER